MPTQRLTGGTYTTTTSGVEIRESRSSQSEVPCLRSWPPAPDVGLDLHGRFLVAQLAVSAAGIGPPNSKNSGDDGRMPDASMLMSMPNAAGDLVEEERQALRHIAETDGHAHRCVGGAEAGRRAWPCQRCTELRTGILLRRRMRCVATQKPIARCQGAGWTEPPVTGAHGGNGAGDICMFRRQSGVPSSRGRRLRALTQRSKISA